MEEHIPSMKPEILNEGLLSKVAKLLFLDTLEFLNMTPEERKKIVIHDLAECKRLRDVKSVIFERHPLRFQLDEAELLHAALDAKILTLQEAKDFLD